MGLKAGLTTYLNARAGLTALVGTRIYPLVIPQGEDNFPAVTYQIISEPNIHSLTGASQLAHPRVQITAWARTALAAENVRDQLVDALDGFAGTMGSITVGCCLKLNERDLMDISPGLEQAQIFGKSIDFEIWYQEPAPTFA